MSLSSVEIASKDDGFLRMELSDGDDKVDKLFICDILVRGRRICVDHDESCILLGVFVSFFRVTDASDNSRRPKLLEKRLSVKRLATDQSDQSFTELAIFLWRRVELLVVLVLF